MNVLESLKLSWIKILAPSSLLSHSKPGPESLAPSNPHSEGAFTIKRILKSIQGLRWYRISSTQGLRFCRRNYGFVSFVALALVEMEMKDSSQRNGPAETF